jgi:hypothetical protein
MTMGHPKRRPIYKQTDSTKFSIIKNMEYIYSCVVPVLL